MSIKWVNVLYLGCLITLSTYLFCIAMWRARGTPIFKNSVLPLLYHRFQYPARKQGENFSNSVWMERVGKQKYVVLRDDADGLGLKLRECELNLIS